MIKAYLAHPCGIKKNLNKHEVENMIDTISQKDYILSNKKINGATVHFDFEIVSQVDPEQTEMSLSDYTDMRLKKLSSCDLVLLPMECFCTECREEWVFSELEELPICFYTKEGDLYTHV